MWAIDPKSKTERENYKLLTGSIIPRPIAFVTTKGENGVINGAPFSYFNIVTADPPLISLSIQRKAGNVMKDTARNIVDTHSFVIHVVDETNVEEINRSAATLPNHQSELAQMDVTMVSSTKIDVPAITEAKVRYECLLEKHIPIEMEKDKITADLIIGRIVQYHIADDVYMENDKINLEKLGAVSRLAGSNYATLGEIVSIERPK